MQKFLINTEGAVFFSHVKFPRQIYYLCSLNGLTTFSFAVLFSSLFLHLTINIKLTHEMAGSIVSLFLTCNFALHLLAGYLGGRFINNRQLYFVALLCQIIGVFLLSLINTNYMLFGLIFFLIGCGFAPTCLNCIVTRQFEPDDERRETAFYLNYCSTNVGFFLGFLASGFFDTTGNYKNLFYLCNFINIITLLVFVLSWKLLEESNTFFNASKKGTVIGAGMIISLIPLMLLAFYQQYLTNKLVLILGSILFIVIYYYANINKNSSQKNKLHTYLMLTFSSIIFWMLFFVGPMGFMNFLKYNTNISVLNYKIPPQWIMNLNSIFVIIGSPMLAFILKKLRDNGLLIPISRQFNLALIAIALSFLCLSIGILFANSDGLSGSFWIVLHFLMQALGELLIGPVGYAMIGKLVPTNLQGILMGLWMMAPGIAATLSHHFSNNMTRAENINPLISNPDYLATFNQLALYALIAAVILYLICVKLPNLLEVGIEETGC